MGGHSLGRGLAIAGALVSAIVTCQWALADGGVKPTNDAQAVNDAQEGNVASATPTGEPELPAGWRELPELVSKAGKSLEGFDAVHKAWGDPANGAFLVFVELSGSAAGDAGLHAALRGAMAKAGKTEISQQASSTDGGISRSQFRFRRDKLAGTVRTRSQASEGIITANSAACFHNQRYPLLSEKQCGDILDSLIGSAPVAAPAAPTPRDGSVPKETP